MRKSKFGGVQEVACAARKNQDTLLGLAKSRGETQLAARCGSCAGRFLGVDNLPGGFADPAAWSGDLEPHLFATDRAHLMRTIFADQDCPAGSAIRAGAAR